MKERISPRIVENQAAAKYGDLTFDLWLKSGLDFGKLWVGPEGSSIRWPGDLEFALVGTMAILELPEALDPQRPSAIAATATFCLKDGGLRRYRLPGESRAHGRALEGADSITFARYDLERQEDSAFAAALTAENPKLNTGHEPELAVLVPDCSCWSPRLLEWIVSHHFRRRELESMLDVTGSSQTLMRFCEDPVAARPISSAPRLAVSSSKPRH